MDLRTVITVGISVIALLVSLLVALRNWEYSKTSAKLTSRNQFMNVLFDIDRQLINRPELWAIYDLHEMASLRKDDPESKARREAFLYIYFSLFEMVFNDFHQAIRMNRRDRDFWRAWDMWIRRFFERSSEGRSLFSKVGPSGIFADGFVKYVNKTLADIAIKPTLGVTAAAVSVSSQDRG